MGAEPPVFQSNQRINIRGFHLIKRDPYPPFFIRRQKYMRGLLILPVHHSGPTHIDSLWEWDRVKRPKETGDAEKAPSTEPHKTALQPSVH